MDKQRILGIVMGGGVVICGAAACAIAKNDSSLGLLVVGIALTVVGTISIVGSVMRWDFLVSRPLVMVSAYLPLMGISLAIQSDTGTAKALWSLFAAGGIVLLLVSLQPTESTPSRT